MINGHWKQGYKDNYSQFKGLPDLVKISFKDSHYLICNGKSLCVVPHVCLQQILASIKLRKVKNLEEEEQYNNLNISELSQKVKERFSHDEGKINPQNNEKNEDQQEISTPLKVGELFYIEFYFTGLGIYYDANNNKLVLSHEKRTAFKIIQHIGKTNSHTRDRQVYDILGQIVPNEQRYLIVMANQLLFLKHFDQNLYLGNYDEKAIVGFTCSIFKSKREIFKNNLFGTPCRLFSVQQEKYVVFNVEQNEILLKPHKASLEGICVFQRNHAQIQDLQSPTLPFHRKKSKVIENNNLLDEDKVVLRVLQGDNNYFLIHKNNIGRKLIKDIDTMIKPLQTSLNAGRSFFSRYEPTFSPHQAQHTFNLSNISSINMVNNMKLDKETQGQITEQLFVREINFRNLAFTDWEELSFMLEQYPSIDGDHLVFIYNQVVGEKPIGKKFGEIKRLYFDHRQLLENGKYQCILKQFNSLRVRRQNSKLKNILRVQYIKRQMLEPYIFYYLLKLNLKICRNYGHLQEHRLKLYIMEIQNALQCHQTSLLKLNDSKKQRYLDFTNQLLQLGFIQILEELVELYIKYLKLQRQENNLKDIEQNLIIETTFMSKIIEIIQSFIQISPEKLISFLLKSKNPILFIILCKIPLIYRLFLQIPYICEGDSRALIERLQQLIYTNAENTNSKCINICLLWAFRLVRQYRLDKPKIIQRVQKLISDPRIIFSEDSLVILQLAKISKEYSFFSRNIIKYFPLQKIQQQYTSLQLCNSFLGIIIETYKSQLNFPFKAKGLLQGQIIVNLEKDNRQILQNFIEDTLSKNCKFESIQNKLISFKICLLYLCFNQGIKQQILINEENCLFYIPFLLVILEEHLQEYIYDEKYMEQYMLLVLQCYLGALKKQLELIVLDSIQMGIDSEEIITRTCNQQLARQFQVKINHQKNRQITSSKRGSKNDKKISQQQRASKLSKRVTKLQAPLKRRTKLINFIFRRKVNHDKGLLNFLDKELIYEIIQSHNSYKNVKLDMLSYLIKISSTLLQPRLKIVHQLDNPLIQPSSITDKCKKIMSMISNKYYINNLWALIGEMCSVKLEQQEWRTIIAIFNKNRLLKYFMLYEQSNSHHLPSQEEISMLFLVMSKLFQHFLKWTKERIGFSHFDLKKLKENTFQVATNQVFYQSDLQPQSIVALLSKQKKIYYCKQQIDFHIMIVKSLGIITSKNIYEYYSNYIIRFQCEKYNIEIIRFILIFIQSLTPTYKVHFTNNMQYTLFRQKSQLRTLITSIIGNKLSQNHSRQSIRAKNFNILSQIDQGSKHKFSIDQNSKKQFIVFLFRLLSVVEKDTTIHKQIISELSYEIINVILFKYRSEILVKLAVINYVVISVEKQLQYGRKKYLKSDSENEGYFDFNEQDEGSEHVALLSFIKHSNYFLQKQTQNFKIKSLRQHSPAVQIKYIQSLLCMMRIRVSISKYLNYERNDKSKWGSNNRQRNTSLYEQDDDQHESITYLDQQGKSNDRKAKQMVYYHTSVSINQNQLQNIQGINKLLCFDLIDSLQYLLQNNKLTKSLQNLLAWLESQYKIILSNYSSLDLENTQENILVYKLSNIIYYSNVQSREDSKSLRSTYIQKVIEKKEILPNQAKQALSNPSQKINHFFSEKIQSYFVLLIQLLQRTLTIKENNLKMMNKSNKYIFTVSQDPEQQIIYIIDLIKSYLQEEIQIYRTQDQKRGKSDFEELPQKYYKAFGVKVLWFQEGNKYKQKCCQIDYSIFQTIFQIFFLSFRIQKPVFVYQLLNIMERLAYYNLANQINLQKIITKHFTQFYQIICSLITNFREISPLVNDLNFIVRSYLNRQYRNQLCIYGLEDQQVLEQNVTNLELHVNSFRGVQGFHISSLNYFAAVRMLLAACKSLNFDFKQLFSRPTIQKQSIINEIIGIFSQMVSNLQIINEEKYEYIRVTIKLINSFLRGPVEENIEAAINKGYCHLLFKLLEILNKKELTSQSEKVYNIKVKKMIAEGIFLLIPFMQMKNQQMKVCQIELRTSFVQSKKTYSSNYQNIILDYIEKADNQTEALLYFDLALNFYYCLIEIYKEKKIDKISKIQLDILNKERKDKKKMKTFKVLYQIYFLLKNIFFPIFRAMSDTYEYIINEKDEKIILNKALFFFTNNVCQIDVKVNNKIKRISFLLLKQARCNNISITKQFHRLIGRDQRQIRLVKFMKLSKFIIIRLQISKQVRKIVQNFKPLQMIILNRQLWKSMCFSNAFLLNLLYIFQNSQYSVDLQLIKDIKYVIIALLYTEILFLFLVYFVEVLPLKIRINRIFSQTAKRRKMILFLIKDKTLGYACFYCFTLTISFYYPGMIAVLMIDYFFRLKITSKTTFMLVRSMTKILYVVFLLFIVLYLSTTLLLSQKNRLDNCKGPAGCTQDLFYVFMELRFNVKLIYQSISLGEGILLFSRYVLKITNLSLMVSIIYMQKKKQHQKSLESSKWIRNQCFICGHERNDIEKKRNSNSAFYHHIQMEHNLWNYIYYLVYLKNKDNKNLNSIENMIIQQWEKEKIDWLPDNLLQAI